MVEATANSGLSFLFFVFSTGTGAFVKVERNINSFYVKSEY